MEKLQDTQNFIRVAALDELKQKTCIVVKGKDRPIAVFYHEGQVHAVDNRCPHMGFPLHKGTVTDGILTCHWHHARFDLTSGCTFDLFADDVPNHAVEIRDDEVWVCGFPQQADEIRYWKQRLQEGMAQNIGLIIAKAIVALLKAGVPASDIVREGALFGARYRDGWASGMTILTALANLVPYLPDEEKFLALYQGLRRVAGDSAGQVPRRDRYSLATHAHSYDTLERWFRYWTLVRHRDGAERTLLTAIDNGAAPDTLATILFNAATDRAYADTGHALDFVNKAFEVLELIGWDQADKILPTVVGQLASARGGEESNSWRHPIDLVPLMEQAFVQPPTWLQEGTGKTWNDEVTLAQEIMGDDPTCIIAALQTAICAGAQPAQLSKALCYAAALRIAHFGTANEFGDWITALHTFTYCNALHQGLKRVSSAGCQGSGVRDQVSGNPDSNGHNAHSDASPVSTQNPPPETRHPLDAVRGVFQGAMSVYLDRFLNVPPAPLPTDRDLQDEHTNAAELRGKFLRMLNVRQQVDESARAVARYLALNHPIEPLIATFAQGVLREDADFHTYQMLEASVQQYNEWGNTPAGRNILIALARYLAAHSPTQRAQLQTAEIALRLHRGEALYEEETEESLTSL